MVSNPPLVLGRKWLPPDEEDPWLQRSLNPNYSGIVWRTKEQDVQVPQDWLQTFEQEQDEEELKDQERRLFSN